MKPEKIAVEADSGQIAQVVRNLIDNAIKFTPEGGSLWLITKVKKKVVTVTVKDSGKGIDADSIPHLFERFYKAEKAHTPGESAGTGLGLAIVKRIIDQHDQDITVESEPGKGTSFTFTSTPRSEASKARHRKSLNTWRQHMEEYSEMNGQNDEQNTGGEFGGSYYQHNAMPRERRAGKTAARVTYS